MNWTTGAGKSINFFDITQKIKSHNKNKGQVIVGTDSHIKMGKCTFTTTIVLIGAKNEHREYTFGVLTTSGIINGSESYPIRSIRSKKYKYILNLNYNQIFILIRIIFQN